jgi:hypothetical protein
MNQVTFIISDLFVPKYCNDLRRSGNFVILLIGCHIHKCNFWVPKNSIDQDSVIIRYNCSLYDTAGNLKRKRNNAFIIDVRLVIEGRRYLSGIHYYSLQQKNLESHSTSLRIKNTWCIKYFFAKLYFIILSSNSGSTIVSKQTKLF